MTTLPADKLRELRLLSQQHRKHLQRASEDQRKLEALLDELDTSSAPITKKQDKDRHAEKLQHAVLALKPRAVHQLLKQGADPNVKISDGEPLVLLAASMEGGEKVLKILLNAGANPDARDEAGNTPLIACANDENLKAVKLLVEAGADVNARNRGGDTPLTNSACWGARQTVKYLLSNGADPELADGAGALPQSLAASQGHRSILKMLLRPRGISPIVR